MMIPNGFPKKAPFIRIVKPGKEYVVEKFYMPLKSPTDENSYILNERLKAIKNWN